MVLTLAWSVGATKATFKSWNNTSPPDTGKEDQKKYVKNKDLKFPFEDNDKNNGGMYLKTPSNVKSEVDYDPSTGEYKVKQKVGDIDYRDPQYMSFDEYKKYDMDKSMRKYWTQKAEAQDVEKQGSTSGLIPKIHIGGEVFDRIFGSSVIDIRPQGSAELIFAVNSNYRQDPNLSINQRRMTTFDFNEKIQMSVTAKIGDKIEFKTNYNTEASFDFENKMKLAYEGKEDEIIKKIEAGDVSLPLSGSLITGSQALFGIKTQLQFGKTTYTGVFSQQKSQSQVINVAGGAQTNKFNIKADQYEENKHFFIAQYFRDNYDQSLSRLPLISSKINITKIEVWVTNTSNVNGSNRNLVACMDLGEPKPYNKNLGSPSNLYPKNTSNLLYKTIYKNKSIRDLSTVESAMSPLGENIGTDYIKIEKARLLNSTEYSFNPKLGFISLNTALNSNQALAVSFQYTVIGDTTLYQVGEFSNQNADPNTLILKLIKNSSLNVHLPIWNLMMKNVYALGSYQINPKDFRLYVLYSNKENGVPVGYLSVGNIKGQSLLSVMNLDRLNTFGDPYPDGVFDFIDNAVTNGGTIQASNGRIYFPVIEPFGKHLRNKIGNKTIADEYAYDSLYTMTKTGAQQFPDFNRFSLVGSYKSSAGSDISLNAINVPQGSVKVTAGGVLLVENKDYTVDYTIGRVKIINEGYLNSGTPIQISLESNTLFNIQTKTLMGLRVDHKVSKDFTLGGTILHLNERPLTQKVNIGDDPISNTIWGLDGTYQTEAPIITKILDKLPFYNTKEMSKAKFSGEFADLIPGHPSAIGKTGTIYIDDFEGSRSYMDIKNPLTWKLAGTPQKQTQKGMFPEAGSGTKLAYGYNRAKLAWYYIDPLFTRSQSATPSYIKSDLAQQSNHFIREIPETEVYPNREEPNGIPVNITTLDLAYYPDERGPYNYDTTSSYSYGLDKDGKLLRPETRWGGIMRKLETTDFEAANYGTLEFWMMDPFVYDPNHNGGDLYFNLGDISEDVLRDSKKSFENGLPTDAFDVNNIDPTKVDKTIWGVVPHNTAIVNSFDNNLNSRVNQDVGLDGLSDANEQKFYKNYLDNLAAKFGKNSTAYVNALNDPSADDYHHFTGSAYDNAKVGVLDRYKNYNGVEGNSPANQGELATSATPNPDMEDINNDNTMNETERYFQYRVSLRPGEMEIGRNNITDILSQNVKLKDGTTKNIKWYQFKIPLNSPDQIIGDIQDFKSIQFVRMFLKNFNKQINIRFASLEVVRSEWRKYDFSLITPGEYIANDNLSQTSFEATTVNIEENGKRTPVPYVLPPGIDRQINVGTSTLSHMNEQSLSLKVCNLQDGDARAIYKTTQFDFRLYKTLNMFAHLEGTKSSNELKTGDLTVFIRLGTDFVNDYYEYEVPLTPTAWGASNPNDIWPSANNFQVTLSKLGDAKLKRNAAMRISGSNVSIKLPYVVNDGANKITVVGTPNLSDVRTIMIGVRNTKKGTVVSDDGLPKCGEVWVDELRLTDFDESGGWAANARFSTNLADLGDIALAGTIITPGFGGIEQKLNDRSKDTKTSFDMASNLELGKFFPEKSGLKIPMHVDYSQSVSTPKYDPLNPDELFSSTLNSLETQAQKDSVKKMSQDVTTRKSINFVNVRKNRVGGTSKSHFYDVENFDLTYSYSQENHSNIDYEYDYKKSYKGAIGYTFNNNPKNVMPFAKVLPSWSVLKLIKDFNFYYSPRSFSFRTDLDREYNETKLRNTSGYDIPISATSIKSFMWNRAYNLRYDLAQSLKFDYTANAQARIDEPQGVIDNSDYQHSYKYNKEFILDGIKHLGRITNFNQSINLNYTVPINKIPLFNWVTSTFKYGADYHWTASPLSLKEYGNQIENSNTKQINASFSFTQLYNKIPYLKKINQPPPKKPVNEEEENKKDTVKVSLKDRVKEVTDNLLKVLMGIKNASVNYSESNGTLLPGFMPSPQYFGMNWKNSPGEGQMAPGLGFVLGEQYSNPDFLNRAINNKWVSDSAMNSVFMIKHSYNFNARLSAEPIKDLKIELNAMRVFTQSQQTYFGVDSARNLNIGTPIVTGNYSISFFTLFTAFKKDNGNNINPVFETFLANRIKVATTLKLKNPNYIKGQLDSAKIFPLGYGGTSQQVLIPAFLGAYTNTDPTSFLGNLFMKIPKPNWRITYDGLSKLELMKRYFKTVTLSHSYTSTYSIGGYTSDIAYKENFGIESARDINGNFVPKYDISQISISESFAPLLGIDVSWKNSLLTKFEIKRSRNLALSLVNSQLIEVYSNEYVIGAGYRFKDVKFALITRKKTKQMKSDLNLKLDIGIRDNRTTIRNVSDDVNTVSAGQLQLTLHSSADYVINERFTVRLFFDYTSQNPYVSLQFPNSQINSGISIRFTLAS